MSVLVVKDYYKRKITHSIFNTNSCVINYNCRRLKCKDCGNTFIENNPFTVSNQKISTQPFFKFLKTVKELTILLLLSLKRIIFLLLPSLIYLINIWIFSLESFHMFYLLMNFILVKHVVLCQDFGQLKCKNYL